MGIIHMTDAEANLLVQLKTSRDLLNLLVQLEIAKHDDYRHDSVYQSKIEIVRKHILNRMAGDYEEKM